MNQVYFYKAFGLTFKSCIEHPEFFAQDETTYVDCIISYGTIPKKITGAYNKVSSLQMDGKKFLLRIENVGRYLIENGNSIIIDRDPVATDREIIIFLWASAIAALLQQRGTLIIHGSAIKVGNYAVIFSGRSGSGKSTIALTFATLKNAHIISDDICAISLNDAGIPVVQPGYPLVKLWRDSSEKLGIGWDENMLIRDNVNKMVVNIGNRFVNEEVCLRQLYFLSFKNQGTSVISEINGYKKMEMLVGKFFRKNYMKKNETSSSEIFNLASSILPETRLCTLDRQHGMAFLDEAIGNIENDLHKTGIYST